MSMPSFPPNGADLTQEEALTMIIASIAMEELALSHIINAEGEKLQYILGALPGTNPCATPQDVLAVNKSVASLLDVVAQNQMLLKSKLEKVLDVCPPPPPPPPCRPKPCPGPPPYPTPNIRAPVLSHVRFHVRPLTKKARFSWRPHRKRCCGCQTAACPGDSGTARGKTSAGTDMIPLRFS